MTSLTDARRWQAEKPWMSAHPVTAKLAEDVPLNIRELFDRGARESH